MNVEKYLINLLNYWRKENMEVGINLENPFLYNEKIIKYLL